MAVTTWTLENEQWRARLVADSGLWLAELTDLQSSAALLAEPIEFCSVTAGDGTPLPIGAEVGKTGEIRAVWTGGTLTVRLEENALRWRVENRGLAAAYTVRFPFLAALYGDTAGDRVYLGRDGFARADGESIIRHADWLLPAVRVAADGRTLTAIASGPPATLRWETLCRVRGYR